MGLGKLCELDPPEFGAAVDADGDNYIIFGKNFFVTPSDSIAIIAAKAKRAIPYFAAGLKGLARTITTSAALDAVAKDLDIICYEVQNDQPQHTADLMDAQFCSIYGEENFSIGSVNIREKDGMWGVLAWLSILALENKYILEEDVELKSVENIASEHWSTYGRTYFACYEYQDVSVGEAHKFMTDLAKLKDDFSTLTASIRNIRRKVSLAIKTVECETHSIRFVFQRGYRMIFTISHVTRVTANICIYVERHMKDEDKIHTDVHEALAPILKVAIKLSNVEKYTDHIAIIKSSDMAPLPCFPRTRLISNNMMKAVRICACEILERKKIGKEIESTFNALMKYTWVSYASLLAGATNERNKNSRNRFLNDGVNQKILKKGIIQVGTKQLVKEDNAYTREMIGYSMELYMLNIDMVKSLFASLFTEKMEEIEHFMRTIEKNSFYKCILCNRGYEACRQICEECGGNSVTNYYGKSEDEYKLWTESKRKMEIMKFAFDVVREDQDRVEHSFDLAVREFEMHLHDELLEEVRGRSRRQRQPGLIGVRDQLGIVNLVHEYEVKIMKHPGSSSSSGSSSSGVLVKREIFIEHVPDTNDFRDFRIEEIGVERLG